jgi:hypothetical protein
MREVIMRVLFQGDEQDQHLRAVQDLEIRSQVFGARRAIKIPKSHHDGFWQWYAEFIRFGRGYILEVDDTLEAIEYPEPDKPVALWYSGGAESTYTLQKISDLHPDLLSIEDYSVFWGPYRRLGQIHFICAVVGAQLGYKQIYIGVEKNELLLCRNAHSHSYVERDPIFLEHWNRYHPQNQLVSVCSHLHKEEIIKELYDLGILITGTCDNIKNGWCGRCFKCFEAFYSAKVEGINLGFQLKKEAFNKFYYNEYQSYITSGFKENPHNALQYFVRLQITYGLEFDCEQDCD